MHVVERVRQIHSFAVDRIVYSAVELVELLIRLIQNSMYTLLSSLS